MWDPEKEQVGLTSVSENIQMRKIDKLKQQHSAGMRTKGKRCNKAELDYKEENMSTCDRMSLF